MADVWEINAAKKRPAVSIALPLLLISPGSFKVITNLERVYITPKSCHRSLHVGLAYGPANDIALKWRKEKLPSFLEKKPL